MKFQLSPGLSMRKIDGEVFIYDRNKSLIHTFNETGALMWEAFEKGLEKKEMMERLLDAYDIDASTASADFDAFFSTLQTLGMVESVL
ncbi:MAG: PqqD family protein [Chitinispirillaceae bacterium]|nr:PqqD family protein [Chitinispirillaceae bacterium]